MALDGPSAALMRQLGELGGPPLHELPVSDARAGATAMLGILGQGPEMARVEEYILPADGGSFGVRALVPHGDIRGVIVYYHGGGWVMGELDQFDPVARFLADRTGCTVVLVDYRLAPEHPFPIPVEDAWTALCWTADHLTELAGADDLPIVVAGDSSGANLAAVTAVRARDSAGPVPVLQVLVYPVTNADLDTPSYRDPGQSTASEPGHDGVVLGSLPPGGLRSDVTASLAAANA
jgi:acetyl esterase